VLYAAYYTQGDSHGAHASEIRAPLEDFAVAEFFTYLITFWLKWIAIVGTFALFAMEPYIQAYWPWAARQLKRLSDQTRHRIEIGILVIAVFYAGFSSWSEERDAKTKVENDLNHAISDRDEARRQRDGKISPLIDRLSGDLVTARAQIDEQSKRVAEQDKQIADLKSPKPARHVTADQKANILQNFTPLAHLFPTLQISVPAGDGNAYAYAQELVDIFKQINGIHAQEIGLLFATSVAGPGPDIFILVKNLSHVPENADVFARTLLNCGFQVRGGKMEQLSDNGFIVVVGPAP
jgi:hypothetical protein